MRAWLLVYVSNVARGRLMSISDGFKHIEVARYLSQIRERAKIKQADLARQITWSPTILSRIESGERLLMPGELETIVDAIATPEAKHLLKLVERKWSVLPPPPLDHPDQD